MNIIILLINFIKQPFLKKNSTAYKLLHIKVPHIYSSIMILNFKLIYFNVYLNIKYNKIKKIIINEYNILIGK